MKIAPKFLEVSFRDNQWLQEVAREMPQAISRALNRVATSARTLAVREVTSAYNVKAKDVRDKITIIRASRNRLAASVRASGKRMNLLPFVTGKAVRDRTRRPRIGLTVQVLKGQRKRIPGSFIAQMKSGHVGVFKRSGETRSPIDAMYTLSVSEMFGSRKVYAKIERHVREKLPDEIHRQVDAIVKGYVK